MLNLLALLYFLFVGFLNAKEVELPSLISYPEEKIKDINAIKKTKVIVFLNRTCPCTQQNIPYINKLAQEHKDMEFIGVHSKKGSTPGEVKEVVEQYKPNFPVIDDSNLQIADLLKANRTPQVFILDKENRILYSGGVTDRTNPENARKPYLKNALIEISQGKIVSEKETRSLGCVILR